MFDSGGSGAGGPGFGLGNYGGQSTSADDSLAIGTDYVVNPKLITDLRLGYLRYNIIDAKNDASTEFANKLGIPGINLGTASTCLLYTSLRAGLPARLVMAMLRRIWPAAGTPQ